MTPQNGTPNGVSAPARTDLTHFLPLVEPTVDPADGALKLALNEIDAADPDIRTDRDNLTYVDSMREEGQRQAIQVYRSSKTSRWTVLDGMTRLMAARILGWKAIKVEVVPEPTSEAALLMGSVLPNVSGTDMCQEDEGRVFSKIRSLEGISQDELALRLGISQSRVSKSEAAGKKLAPELHGKLPKTIAAILQRFPDHDEQRRLAGEFRGGNLDRTKLTALANAATGRAVKLVPLDLAVSKALTLIAAPDLTPKQMRDQWKAVNDALAVLIDRGWGLELLTKVLKNPPEQAA